MDGGWRVAVTVVAGGEGGLGGGGSFLLSKARLVSLVGRRFTILGVLSVESVPEAV